MDPDSLLIISKIIKALFKVGEGIYPITANISKSFLLIVFLLMIFERLISIIFDFEFTHRNEESK